MDFIVPAEQCFMRISAGTSSAKLTENPSLQNICYGKSSLRMLRNLTLPITMALMSFLESTKRQFIAALIFNNQEDFP